MQGKKKGKTVSNASASSHYESKQSSNNLFLKWGARFLFFAMLAGCFHFLNSIYPNNILSKTFSKVTVPESVKPMEKPQAPPVGTPNYEEYIQLATQNKWNPVDPVAKLEDTIKRYPLIFDLDKSTKNSEHIDEYIKLLHAEVDYLLKVLVKSKHRKIDLSHLIFMAVDVMNQCSYRVMKQRVQLKSPSIVTKALAEQWTRHWLYHPLKELVSLKSKNYSHIIIDGKRRDAHSNFDAFSKAVQYRLYGLFTTFAWFGTDQLTSAFHLAIINGDDLAVALLLRICESNAELSKQLTITNLLLLIDTTESLHFEHIKKRLIQTLGLVMNKLPPELQKTEIVWDKAIDIVNASTPAREQSKEDIELYNEFHPSISTTNTDAGSEDHAGDMKCLAKEKRILSEDSLSHSCAIPSVNIEDLSLNQFYHQYVQNNRPVAIRLNPEHHKKLLKEWTEENLLRVAQDSKTWMSHIPYGSLFGEVEQSLSLPSLLKYIKSFESELKEFTTSNNFNMTAFYQKRCSSQTTSQDGKGSIEKQHEYENFQHCIPLYLFSNDQQEITQKVKTMMIDYLKDASGNSSMTMWDYIFAVSTSNSTLLPENHALVPSLSTKTLPTQRGKFQFFFGPSFSGAPWHSHGPAFNLVLHGRKRWNLFPPGRDLYTRIHPVEWIGKDIIHTNREYPFNHTTADIPCYHYQNAGEILYVPRHYSHQVLNMEKTMGFAVEVDQYVY